MAKHVHFEQPYLLLANSATINAMKSGIKIERTTGHVVILHVFEKPFVVDLRIKLPQL